MITVPVEVEAVWALISPKIGNSRNKIKQISVCAIYYKGPKSPKKKKLFDQLAERYNILMAKYGSSLQFIIDGDTNKLNHLGPLPLLETSCQSSYMVVWRSMASG